MKIVYSILRKKVSCDFIILQAEVVVKGIMMMMMMNKEQVELRRDLLHFEMTTKTLSKLMHEEHCVELIVLKNEWFVDCHYDYWIVDHHYFRNLQCYYYRYC